MHLCHIEGDGHLAQLEVTAAARFLYLPLYKRLDRRTDVIGWHQVAITQALAHVRTQALRIVLFIATQ